MESRNVRDVSLPELRSSVGLVIIIIMGIFVRRYGYVKILNRRILV